MNSSSPSRLDAYRAVLEFIFWTCREILKLALFAAITACCIVSLIQGDRPWMGKLLTLASRLFGR